MSEQELEAIRAAGLTSGGGVICSSLTEVPRLARALRRAAIFDEFTAAARDAPGLRAFRLTPELRFPILAVRGALSSSRMAGTPLIAGVTGRPKLSTPD